MMLRISPLPIAALRQKPAVPLSETPHRPRFGFTRSALERNPSLYWRPLTVGEDVEIHQGEATPTQKLIERIRQEMASTQTEHSRFLAIPIPKLPQLTEAAWITFQTTLFNAVINGLQQTADFPQNPLIRTFPVSDGKSRQPDGFILPAKQTLKRMHIDPNALVFSHLYLPYENVSGGDFQLFDFRQMMQDQNLPFDAVFEMEANDFTHEEEPMIRAEMQQAAKPYIFDLPLDTMFQKDPNLAGMMVFVNNAQIAHGASPAQFPESGPFRRDFQRISSVEKGLKPWPTNSLP